MCFFKKFLYIFNRSKMIFSCKAIINRFPDSFIRKHFIYPVNTKRSDNTGFFICNAYIS